ncbi:MFS transporter [Amycolatopsis carbonis]|uniref:MFS transporter n=1 Tax=Amycolatopsis carbonis TaxID=715471 RepID=A0A9Y2IB21_9PSEU|nr:MFS transporter [Amycolatopsis sp. 2-15]WIX76792.1 MFS transporter [Amycolatopsis sp. 2-15]
MRQPFADALVHPGPCSALTLAPVLVITGLAGLAGGVNNPIIGAVSYERIPEHLHARVLGAIKASAWIGIPFGSLLGGALTAGTGLTTALLASGTAMLIATLTPLVFPAWRQLDTRHDNPHGQTVQ